MATPGPKKVSELPLVTAFSNTDLFVVLANTTANSATAVTSAVTSNNMMNHIFGSIAGPYADDFAAQMADVPVGRLYHDSDGIVRIRLS